MFIIMSSTYISLVDRITSFIIKKEIRYMCGSPFIIMSREKRIRLRMLRPHRIGFWLKSPAKKWLTVVELRRGGSTNNNPSEKTISTPFIAAFELIVNPSSIVSIMKMIFRLLWIKHGVFQLYCVFHWGEIKRIPPLWFGAVSLKMIILLSEIGIII